MHENIKVVIDRADEILGELKREYDAAMKKQEVTARSMQLTHDVLEKLRSALDRLARRYWEKHISPNITEADRAAAAVYFPISDNAHAFDSVMGRWRWKSVRSEHSSLEAYLTALQPFSSSANTWLVQFNSLVNDGKHVDLSPQTRVENRQITVSHPSGGQVSWGSGVTFGSGVSIMGVPVDPRTQRVVPNNIVEEKVVIWVDFNFKNYPNSAYAFCRDSLLQVRGIAEVMSDRFDLG